MKVYVILALAVTMAFLLGAQRGLQAQSGVGFLSPAQVLACADFTPANVIDVLAEYDVKHLTEIPDFGSTFWGLTQPWNRRIYISGVPSMADRREVVIHELLHAICYNKGVQTGGPAEPFIEQRAQETYQRIYGTPAPDFPVEAEEPTPDTPAQSEELQ